MFPLVARLMTRLFAYFQVFKVYEENDPVSEQQQQYNMQYILAQLAVGGLEVRLSYSIQVIAASNALLKASV